MRLFIANCRNVHGQQKFVSILFNTRKEAEEEKTVYLNSGGKKPLTHILLGAYYQGHGFFFCP